MNLREAQFNSWVDAMTQKFKQVEDANTLKKIEMYPQEPSIPSNALLTPLKLCINPNKDGHPPIFKARTVAGGNHRIHREVQHQLFPSGILLQCVTNSGNWT